MGHSMKIDDVRRTAYSMPLTNPSFPPGPYRFFNREYFIITYRTDPEALAAVVPEPLEVNGRIVKYEFIRMPDSTGFGDYTETGQVIPVRFKGEEGAYVHSMYLTTRGRSPAVANSGAFRRSWRRRRSWSRATCWWERCITARCSALPPPWATSTARSIMTRS